MIRLFTSVYPERDPLRREELDECLARNLACRAIAEVCLIVEPNVARLPESEKVRVRHTGRRPTYADFFSWINQVVSVDDLSIVANSDIYFDESVDVLNRRGPLNNQVFALARYDMINGEAVLNDRNDSQDAWIFRGRIRGVAGDYCVGVPRCDNRLIKELEMSGMRVRNPAFSLRSYHLHAGQREEYSGSNQNGFVDGPYGYAWPDNLMSLPATLLQRVLHPSDDVRWRFNRRAWNRRLKLHLLKRAQDAVGSLFNRAS